jgi:hypothetical protein
MALTEQVGSVVLADRGLHAFAKGIEEPHSVGCAGELADFMFVGPVEAGYRRQLPGRQWWHTFLVGLDYLADHGKLAYAANVHVSQRARRCPGSVLGIQDRHRAGRCQDRDCGPLSCWPVSSPSLSSSSFSVYRLVTVSPFLSGMRARQVPNSPAPMTTSGCSVRNRASRATWSGSSGSKYGGRAARVPPTETPLPSR